MVRKYFITIPFQLCCRVWC